MPRGEAMLTENDRILHVGSRYDIERLAPMGCTRVDLGGMTVVPGFNDCHAHILEYGLALDQIDASPDSVSNISDLVASGTRRAAVTTPGEWILGRGYDQNALAERRHPTRADLDAVSRGHPIVFWHTSLHALAANTRALELAGINRNTNDPSGGQIERDEHGEPTGVLKEAAMDLINRVIPRATVEQGARAILRAMESVASSGISSATDAATGHGPSLEPELHMYREANLTGRLAGRITLYPRIEYVAPAGADTIRRPEEFDVGDDPHWLAISGVKVFSDGALSTRTAAMREPYFDDPDNSGILLWEPEVLLDMIRRAHGAGWQIAAHALGDRAVEVVLDCYQRVLTDLPRPDHRHRIEHCMVCGPDLAKRIQALGVVPVLQPDIHRLGVGYVAALGIERAREVIPTALFDALNIRTAFSSDCPVIPCDPFQVIRSAWERVTPSGVSLRGVNSVNPLESIGRYTTGSAYATRTDSSRGILRRGMLADFVVLSRDPDQTPIKDFGSVRVVRTVTGGVVRYGA